MKDSLGDRMKVYENIEAQRKLIPLLPICVRLDGRSFSGWTNKLDRPYDKRLHDIMVGTTISLVQETNARIGYTESDEISLIIYSDNIQSEVYFGGRIQKIVSTLSALASLYFDTYRKIHLPDYKVESNPSFDCRVWNVPNKEEAVNTILWRELDATKNSIQQASRYYFSHNQLLNKNTSEMNEMLHQIGINWNDYPDWFKRGTYVQRKAVETPFTPEEINLLPPKHNARKDPTIVTKRNIVNKIEMPPLAKISNRVNVIFDGENPT